MAKQEIEIYGGVNMSKSAKGSLVHGIINVMLPIVVVLIHSGAFGVPSGNNAWNYFYVGILLIFIPIISSVAGIMIASILLKKSHEKSIWFGLLFSIVGLIEQIVFRFVLMI